METDSTKNFQQAWHNTSLFGIEIENLCIFTFNKNNFELDTKMNHKIVPQYLQEIIKDI